jgi:dihydroorotase
MQLTITRPDELHLHQREARRGRVLPTRASSPAPS